MARIITKESLDSKIEKLENAILKNREQYEKLTVELEDLKKKQKEMQYDELLKAIDESPKSIDEILSYLQSK